MEGKYGRSEGEKVKGQGERKGSTEGTADQEKSKIINKIGTSLVAQWLRIRLPMQATRVRALVWEDPTCCEATKPMCHNY